METNKFLVREYSNIIEICDEIRVVIRVASKARTGILLDCSRFKIENGKLHIFRRFIDYISIGKKSSGNVATVVFEL